MGGNRTSQRARLLVLMAVLMVAGVVGQSALISTYLQRDFQRLEQTQVQGSLRLIQLWLDRFLQPMEALASEVSTWRELARPSLDEPALTQRLAELRRLDSSYDVLAIIGADGTLQFTRAFARPSGAGQPLGASQAALLVQNASALRKAGLNSLSGWGVVPGGLFASAGLQLQDGRSIVVGRHFGDTEMSALDDLSGTRVSTLVGEAAPEVRPGHALTACTRLSPLLNAGPEQLCVQLQDSIIERGLRSSQDLRLASLAGFVVLMFGTWWFIDRSLLRRLVGLTAQLQDTSSAGTDALEAAMLDDGRRGDELGTMSSGLGRLLGRVRQAESDLRERERSFRVLSESSGVAIFVLRDGVVYSNPFASELTGYEVGELRGRNLGELVHPDWREPLEGWIRRGAVEDRQKPQEVRGLRQDGTLYWAELQLARIEYQGQPALLATLIDVSEQRHLEKVLADEKQNLQVILSSIHDGIVAVDHTGTVRFLNPAAQRLTGVPEQLAHGSPLEEVLALSEPESGRALASPLLQTLSADSSRASTLAQVTTPQGLSRSVEVSLSRREPSPAGTSEGSVLVLRDVSDLRQLTQTLALQATHDDLTSLINRREFSRRLKEALDRVRNGGPAVALCYLDLDQFKLLNDTCGHHAGDLMLREIADTLRRHVAAGDTLARLGGDEFGVLLEDCPPERAVVVANELREVIAKVRFQWSGQNFSVDASLGITMLDQVEGGVDEALALADAACYMAKDLGRNRVHLYHTSDIDLQQQLKHMRWATRLKEAVENSQFLLYAQGILPVSSSAPHLHACEALVRMRQPDGRIVTPEEFLAAAERYQLMNHIDRWVVNAALAALKREHDIERETRPLLFVNLSGQSLGDEGFRDFLLGRLNEYPELCPQLVFEVTESAVISSLSRAKQLMADVYERGCAFALDDFGTGMSSFSYLKEMRVDYLKIAGTFVKHVNTSPLDDAVCRSFTQFARMLNVTVIAEWIEDEAILGTLRGMGVDYGQGWHFGRPAPIEQVLGLPS